MGMAASQARYLALVARKSNCEYEGQQINQARLALSNQSANLFNQMLGLTVPVPPSTQDYTTTQYSFSDGSHDYVIDNWRQLPESDTQYNYIVNTHYFTDEYTGAMRRMSEPQVQLGGIASNGIATISQIQNARSLMRAAESAMDERYNYWQLVRSTQEAEIALIRRNAQDAMESQVIDNQITAVAREDGDGYYRYNITGDGHSYVANIYSDDDGDIPVDADSEPRKLLQELSNMIELGVISIDRINQAMWTRNGAYQAYQLTDISDLEFNGGQYTNMQKALLDTFAYISIDGNTTDYYIDFADNLDLLNTTVNAGETGILSGYQIYHSNGAEEPEAVSMGEEYLDAIEDANSLITTAYNSYLDSKHTYENYRDLYRGLVQPTYIGNSELTYLDQLTEEQEIELHQVVKDMKAQGIDTDILNRFDEDGNYLGGIYSFTIYGTTYYTTYDNLLDAYASNPDSNNYIDAQYRMPYYNASYINTRVDMESRALVETDSGGRFSSIRFENDSISYALHMETITDDEAYQDAMNQYYYENAKYDKMVQDINAKTSIIHQQDQELELRLKQLDTEQNALSNEIDAVSKVVKDNVESSFKTFGG